MGGENESVLAAPPRREEILNVADLGRKKGKGKKKRKVQTQTIRQHVSGGECHFHDDQNSLKVAIPVADWFNILRQLQKMETVKWVDAANSTVANFRPSVEHDVFDVSIVIKPIAVSAQFKAMSGLAKPK